MPRDITALHDILLEINDNLKEIRDSLKSIDKNGQAASAMKLFLEKMVGDVTTDAPVDDDDRGASPTATIKSIPNGQHPTKRPRGRPRKNPEQPPPSPPNPKPPPPANYKHTDKHKQKSVDEDMYLLPIPQIE